MQNVEESQPHPDPDSPSEAKGDGEGRGGVVEQEAQSALKAPHFTAYGTIAALLINKSGLKWLLKDIQIVNQPLLPGV